MEPMVGMEAVEQPHSATAVQIAQAEAVSR
jgi:hypothetical protein